MVKGPGCIALRGNARSAQQLQHFRRQCRRAWGRVLQLVKANPAMGMGAMQGVTYIQRVATQGGVAPAAACTAANAGQKQVVKYQADYIIWKAAS